MSEIRANTISDAAGTGPIDLYKQSAAKAWINASSNGGGAAGIRGSYNVSSITDDATGRHTITLTSAMSGNGHSPSLSGSRIGSGDYRGVINHRDGDSASTIGTQTTNDTWTNFDWDYIFVQTHGDLA